MARGDDGAFDEWAAYINAKLGEAHMTPKDLADATGIKAKTVYNWTGARGSISADMATLVAQALGAPLPEVLRKAGHPLVADAIPTGPPREAGTPPEPVDPVIAKILAIPGLSEEDKSDFIRLHIRRRERLAEASIAAAEAAAEAMRRDTA